MSISAVSHSRASIRRIFAALILCMIAALPAFAETVSQKMAKNLAQQFFNQVYKENSAPVKYVYNGKRLTTANRFPPFYVYNHQRGGFVIISAENKTFPILAYSLEKNFNPDNLSDSEKGWLKSYAMDIEMIRFDSRVPYEAIEVWRDYPQYVVNLLDAKYEATDPRIAIEESASALDAILRAPEDSSDASFSAVYTPGQWQELIDTELRSNQSVAIGYVDFDKELFPGVVYGKKGDYYKIAFEDRNEWMMRLSAAEYFGDRLIASLGYTTYTPEPEPEDVPFAYYESIREEERAEAAAVEEARMIKEMEPVVKPVGGGHFDILLPENVSLAMIYNIDGAHIGRKTYKGTPMAHIDIEAEPRGFYFALIIGESGRPYGIKLYR